jgi:GNAT superfamily N-acetyltransferase
VIAAPGSGTAGAIRAATPDDLEALAPLRLAFWQDQIGKGLLDAPALDDESLRAATAMILKRPRSPTLLWGGEGGAAGYATGVARMVPGQAAHRVIASIEELYVDPARGNVSAAMLLMRRMISDLRALGATRIQARVLTQNRSSQKFHELCGFYPSVVINELDFSQDG